MRGSAGPDDIEVFATGDTLLVAACGQDLDGPPSAVAGLLRRGGETLRDYHARPGFRPGQRIATTSGRRNGVNDIVRPVLVDPRRACAVAMSGALFAEPVIGFELDGPGDGVGDDHDYLVWHAALTGDGMGHVPVSLHLLASPSMVVTVIELVPQRRVRWNRDAFVRAGVRVTETVAARLTSAPHADITSCAWHNS